MLEKTNAVNVACQSKKRSTWKILIRNNNLPFPMTLLFLTSVLSLGNTVFVVEMNLGPVHGHIIAKCKYIWINCSGT